MNDLVQLIERNKVFVKDLNMEMLPVSIVREIITKLQESSLQATLQTITNNVQEINKEIQETVNKIAEGVDEQ